jgi:nicotinamidase-related amidase
MAQRDVSFAAGEGYPLDRLRSALVVIDVQGSLLAAIPDSASLLSRIALLIQAANTLDVPVLTTTQNAARLGGIVPQIHELLSGDSSPIDKLSFSAVRAEDFTNALQETGRSQVVVCGVETHICVAQTAIDLKLAGYAVTVVPDACGARSVERHKLGMERIRDLGVLPAAAESVVYEWLEEAGTPEFRTILSLVKSL